MARGSQESRDRDTPSEDGTLAKVTCVILHNWIMQILLLIWNAIHNNFCSVTVAHTSH